ncbi:hypothetical protein D9756_005645 [Leucocoprinus leucothites]|uniref:BTB domain-containing protein n=1 Tax=Leucocoprinus leucothites TaxID=201217 RepID=A0A8H5FZQ4_9AGAR|nr:hypothetical protein D9756_005645 [Leucoagaricus leucothites]
MAYAHSEFTQGFRSIIPYEKYCLPGGDLFLIVDHHSFRVHRYFFERESIYFKRMLTMPPSPGNKRPGASESSAILLDDVKVDEFARFLWVFYNPKYSLYHTSVAEWTTILSLAHRWSFAEVKALAVRELEKKYMPDIDRVIVYQDYEVDHDLLTPYYAALCERDEPITPAEGRRMGIDTALTIAQLREMARRSPVDYHFPTSATIRGDNLHPLVREMFGIAAPVVEGDTEAPPTPSAASFPATGINGSDANVNGLTANGSASTGQINSTDAQVGNNAIPTATGHSSTVTNTMTGPGVGATASGREANPTTSGTPRARTGNNQPAAGQGQASNEGTSPLTPRQANLSNASREGEEKGKEGGTGTGWFGAVKTRRNGGGRSGN